ncbi:MAG: hypothetical protein HN348_09305 [Proteobacteria bacterium]|nr:hypothetical protein [Pseudomonadota bacterium]
MIRCWGFGRVGNNETALPKNAFGVFQFFKFSVVVTAEGLGDPTEGGVAAAVAVRSVHDFFKKRQDGEPNSLVGEALVAANEAVFEVKNEIGIPEAFCTLCVAVFGATDLYFAQYGPADGILIQGGQSREVAQNQQAQFIGIDETIQSPPVDHIPLAKNDTFVIGVGTPHELFQKPELQNLDWSMPQRSASCCIEICRDVNGDDHGVVVAVAMVSCPEFIAPTPPPDIQRFKNVILQKRGHATEARRRRIAIDEVKPEWGQGHFIEEDELVEREQLTYQEGEKKEQEEIEIKTLREYLLEKWKAVLNLFETPEGRRQAAMIAGGLAATLVLLLLGGLVFGFGENPPESDVADERPKKYQVSHDGLFVPPSKIAQTKPSAATPQQTRKQQPVQPKQNKQTNQPKQNRQTNRPNQFKPPTNLPAESEPMQSASLTRVGIALGLMLLIGLGSGVVIQRKNSAEQRAADEALRGKRKARLRQVLSVANLLLDDAWVSGHGDTGFAYLPQGTGLMLATQPPAKKTAKKKKLNLEKVNFAPPTTRIVKPSDINGVTVSEHFENVFTNQGGRTYAAKVASITLELTMNDFSCLSHTIEFLDEPVVAHSEEHRQAQIKARLWKARIVALMRKAQSGDTNTRLGKVFELVKLGIVTTEEYGHHVQKIHYRRSSPWRSIAV